MYNFLKRKFYRGMAQEIIIERICLEYDERYLVGLCDMAYDLGLIRKSEMEQYLDTARRQAEQKQEQNN